MVLLANMKSLSSLLALLLMAFVPSVVHARPGQDQCFGFGPITPFECPINKGNDAETLSLNIVASNGMILLCCFIV